MKMTKRRKQLQDKLRRKFGWKTEGSAFGGSSALYKEKATTYSKRQISNEAIVVFDDYQLWGEFVGKNYAKGVLIAINQYDDSTDEQKLLDNLMVGLTFKELELIYKIAKEKQFEMIRDHQKREEQ